MSLVPTLLRQEVTLRWEGRKEEKIEKKEEERREGEEIKKKEMV